MANKPTKRDYLAEIRALIPAERTDLIAFIDHEDELLKKKNAAKSNKPTKTQLENIALTDAIYDFMKDGVRYTVTELNKTVPQLVELSGNKVSSLVRILKLDGRVVRVEEKGKAYFVKAQSFRGRIFSPLPLTRARPHGIIPTERQVIYLDEKLIALHMRTLKCTREEAIQLIQDDKETDRGISHDWDLSAEQMKNARKLANAGTRKVTTTTRTRKENPVKQEIISTIYQCMSGYTGAENVNIANAERTVDFTVDGVNYTVTLTAHRAKQALFFQFQSQFTLTGPEKSESQP